MPAVLVRERLPRVIVAWAIGPECFTLADPSAEAHFVSRASGDAEVSRARLRLPLRSNDGVLRLAVGVLLIPGPQCSRARNVSEQASQPLQVLTGELSAFSLSHLRLLHACLLPGLERKLRG